MRWLALLLVLGCGGMADSPAVQDVAQPLEQGGWCCETGDGSAVTCGHEQKTSAVCYCAGVVGVIDGTCRT